MTIIVYDNNALITDSLGMVKFGETDRLGYHANKIHYNESRTIAVAYSGETRSDSINQWLFRRLETQFALIDLMDLYDVTGEAVVRTAIKKLTQIQEFIPVKPNENNSGIAISRDYAIHFDSNGYFDVTGQKYIGEGAAVEAYWVMRRAGRTPAQAMEKLDQISQLCGGPINMQLQSGLQKPDIKKYCMEFVEKKEFDVTEFKTLRLDALAPPKAARKRKAV